jgi:hypothetical protein
MSDARTEAFAPVMQAIDGRVVQAFWLLDDIMVALSPDAPQHVADAWSALHAAMSPEFIAARDRYRGLKEEVS